jgi:hypothetical protein
VAEAYEKRALEDVVPEALAGLADLVFALMGVEEDGAVLDINALMFCDQAPDVRML